ncbi:TPA: DUF6685 family protein [Serratia marcescens]|nr:hypothetical protein [Serratia marcescens]
MSDDPGRSKFVDLPADARPSFWRSIAGRVYEGIMHSLGRPARLENAIASGQLIPRPLIAPVDTFWTRSVVYWQDWMSSPLPSFHSRPWTIDYRKLGYLRELESHSLAVPELQQLISKEDVPHFTCDITDIRGISASKSMEHDIRDIDAFPILRCRELAEPVTEEYLWKNMSHRELRLDRMRFAEYQWAERRLYWLNEGGSHHFGAARYQACRLGIAVPLTGRLCRYSVNARMVSALRQQWHLFAIPADELLCSFLDAMNAFECPFGNSDLPRHMHDADKSGIALKLVWLDRSHPRASAVADVLSAAGFPDFGKQLKLLATQTAETISREVN